MVMTILRLFICMLSGAIIWFVSTQLLEQAEHRKWEKEEFKKLIIQINSLRKELDIYKHFELKKGEKDEYFNEY